MDLFQSIQAQIADTVAKVKAAKADGTITFQEAYDILADAVAKLVAIASLLNLSGPEKKQAVMDAVGKAFDFLAAHVNVPYVPEIIETTLIDPPLKAATLMFASGVIEMLVSRMK